MEASILTESEINYDATTISDAKAYLNLRYLQLKKFGFVPREELVVEGNSVVTLYDSPTNENYGSVYVLKQFRGQQIFIKRIQQFMIKIVTLEECDISSYLNKIKCEYTELKHSPAYKLTQEIYGDSKTNRTGVPLMNHIEEGGAILEQLGVSDIVKDAYYLHPLLQSDKSLLDNKSLSFGGVDNESIILAMEYRRVANSYLSTMIKEDFVGFPMNEIWEMLVADKVQNYKDFLKYHMGTHERSNELNTYFNNWFDLLGIDYNEYKIIIE